MASSADMEDLFLSRLIEERQRELSKIKDDSNVKAALLSPDIWAPITANMKQKQYRAKEFRSKRLRRLRRLRHRGDHSRIGWSATHDKGDKIVDMFKSDQQKELDSLRSQRVVRNRLLDPSTPSSTRKMFKKGRHSVKRVRCANVLISSSDHLEEEITKVMQVRSESFVEQLFQAPSRPKLVLNRYTSVELNSIAAAELNRVKKVKEDYRKAADNSHRNQKNRSATNDLMDSLVQSGISVIPESVFIRTDNNEATPTMSPVSTRRSSEGDTHITQPPSSKGAMTMTAAASMASAELDCIPTLPRAQRSSGPSSQTISSHSSAEVSLKLHNSGNSLELESVQRQTSYTSTSTEFLHSSSEESCQPFSTSSSVQFTMSSTNSITSSSMQQDDSFDVSSPTTPIFDASSPLFTPAPAGCDHPLSSEPEATPNRRRSLPNEALKHSGFIKYCKELGLSEPTREDYICYHLNVYAGSVEEENGFYIDQYAREMVITVMKTELSYSSFYEVTNSLAKVAKSVQDKAMLIGVFGRTLSWKLPELQEKIAEFTARALMDIATDFLSLLPFHSPGLEGCETVLPEEGWNEVFMAARNEGVPQEDLLQILEYDCLPSSLPTGSPSPLSPWRMSSEKINTATRTLTSRAGPLMRGLSGPGPAKQVRVTIRRSKSVEVLITSASKSQQEPQDDLANSRLRDLRSLTPSLLPEKTHSRSPSDGGQYWNNYKQPRKRYESDPHPTGLVQDKPRKLSLQELSANVVPYLPAAAVALHVTVYAAMKIFSN